MSDRGERTGTELDMVIFDVDGVLLDTSGSFPAVIASALLWAWTCVLGRVPDGEGFTLFHFAATKTHPSFNDDYDIAWAMINCVASAETTSLERAMPSPERWRTVIQGCGADVPLWVRRTFGETVCRHAVRACCEELYFGREYLEARGRKPLYATRQGGFWERERPLMDIRWTDIPRPVGIYTGRTDEELDLALRLLKWEDFPREMTVTADRGIKKPSPDGLALLCEWAGAVSPLFLGDAESDRRALENYGRGSFAAIGTMIPGEFPHDRPRAALERFGVLTEGERPDIMA